MRLDFDHDGSVSVEDLKQSMFGLYEFLRNFDVIETTSSIKGKIYQEAIAYMQNELEQEQRQRAANKNHEAAEAPVEKNKLD